MGEWSGWEGWKRWGQRGQRRRRLAQAGMTGCAGQAARQREMIAPTCAAGDLAWLRWRAHVVKGKMVQGLEWCVGNGEQARFVLEVGLISSRVTEHPKYQLIGR